MDKIDKVLDSNWIDFNRKLMQLNLKQLKEAVKREKSGQNRSTFISRLKKRIRKLAGEMTTKGL